MAAAQQDLGPLTSMFLHDLVANKMQVMCAWFRVNACTDGRYAQQSQMLMMGRYGGTGVSQRRRAELLYVVHEMW